MLGSHLQPSATVPHAREAPVRAWHGHATLQRHRGRACHTKHSRSCVVARARAGQYRQDSYDDTDPWPGAPQEPGGVIGLVQTTWSWAVGAVNSLVATCSEAFLNSPLAPAEQTETSRTAVTNSIRGALALVGLALLKGVLSVVLVLGAVVLAVYVATQVFGFRGPSMSGRSHRRYSSWNGGDPRSSTAQAQRQWRSDPYSTAGPGGAPPRGYEQGPYSQPGHQRYPGGGREGAWQQGPGEGAWGASGVGGAGAGGEASTWDTAWTGTWDERDTPAFQEAARTRPATPARRPGGGVAGGSRVSGGKAGEGRQRAGQGSQQGGVRYNRKGDVIDVFYDPPV